MTQPNPAHTVLLELDQHELEEISLWLMLLLTVVTLGIYYLYWIWSRSQALAQRASDTELLSRLTLAVLAVGAVGLVLDLTDMLHLAGPTLKHANSIVTSVQMLLSIGWTLLFRGAFNRMTGADPADGNWNNLFWALLFGGFYHQYKINRHLAVPSLRG